MRFVTHLPGTKNKKKNKTKLSFKFLTKLTFPFIKVKQQKVNNINPNKVLKYIFSLNAKDFEHSIFECCRFVYLHIFLYETL